VVADDTMERLVNVTFHGASPAAAASGAAWSLAQIVEAPTPRMGHVFLEFEDRVLVIGGYQSAPDEPRTVWSPSRRLLADHASRFLLSDVWALLPLPCGSGDGSGSGETLARDQVCANASLLVGDAAFSGRHSHAGAVLAGAVYIVGGVTQNAALARDVWRTTDGTTWTQVHPAPCTLHPAPCLLLYSRYWS